MIGTPANDVLDRTAENARAVEPAQAPENVGVQPDSGAGHQFAADERQPRLRFGRHQVAELPPISVTFNKGGRKISSRDGRSPVAAIFAFDSR